MAPGASPTITWERQPADSVRCAMAVVVGTIAISISIVRPDEVRGISSDLVELLARLPDSFVAVIIGLLQIGALAIPLTAIGFVVRRRWRELALVAGSAFVAAVSAVIIGKLIGDSVPPEVINGATRPSWITGGAFPSGTYLAAAAAAVTAAVPSVTRPWRRFAWAGLVLAALARVITAVEVPVNLAATICVGISIGSAALIIFGAPARHPSVGQLREAFGAAGIEVVDAVRIPGTPANRPVFAVQTASDQFDVGLIDRDERNADLLARTVRTLFVTGVQERWPTSTREASERQLLVHFLARAEGAPVAKPITVGTTTGGAFVAVAQVRGTRLSDLGDALTDDVLRKAFIAVAALRRARIAHCRLMLEELTVDSDGEVWITDLRWATPAATERQLATDVAELLTSTALHVGAQRAADAAGASLTKEELGAALPFVQRLAMSAPLARELRGHRMVLADVRTEVQRVSGAESIEMAHLHRITLRGMVMFVATLVLANLLLSLVANFDDIWAALKEIDLWALPMLTLLALVGYPLGAISLMGAVDVKLPFVRTTQVMFAQSFLNRFTPANAGGMALRARFLQLNGVALVVAAASVGLTSAASGVMQVAVVMLCFLWAGNESSLTSFDLPSGTILLIVVIVVLVAAGIVLGTAFGKRLWAKVRISLRQVIDNLRSLVKQPTKLMMLFGGAGLAKVAAILAFAQAASAFDVAPGLAAIGVVYLTATTVSAAAPTPGGVGVVEAALTAGLTGLGYPVSQAAAVVLIFRLFTYWLPILPCWLALARLKSIGEV